MTNPIAFPALTPNLGLPLLFAGQSQKEFFVNAALAIVDALAPRAVVATRPDPPAASLEGECYRIAAPAEGDWSGREDALATRIGDSWHYVAPVDGMTVFDRGTGRWALYRSGWQEAVSPAAPEGGSVIDVEARAALGALIAGLQSIGVLAPAPA